MPVAILPAAGRSARMGRPKLLLPFDDTTVVGAVVRCLRNAGVERLVLVVAPGDQELAQWAREEGLKVTVNPVPGRGMLSSILEGLAALGGAESLARQGRVLLVCPADLPAVKSATVRHLLIQMKDREAALAVPTYEGRRGHPLAIGPPLIAELLSLDPEVGLRQLLHRHPGKILEIPVDDPGVISDIDTPEDYSRLLR